MSNECSHSIQFVLNNPFNIETHKNVFVNYLEVIIDEQGTVHYAVPSHQEWLINTACKKFNMTRDEITTSCPVTSNTIEWLCKITGSVSVWNNNYIGKLNDKQIEMLTLLQKEGLYKGDIISFTDEDLQEWIKYNNKRTKRKTLIDNVKSFSKG